VIDYKGKQLNNKKAKDKLNGGKNIMKGFGVSSGIAIGKALLKTETRIEIVKKTIGNPDEEIMRLEKAKSLGRKEIDKLYYHALDTIGREEALIFDTHKMILDAPELFGQVNEKIRRESVSSEWALQEVANDIIEIFNNMDNEYIKERILDVKDVTERIMKILLNIETSDLYDLREDVIIVAKDLTPSDIVSIDKSKVLGLIAELGSKYSHFAIMVKALGIPAVIGVQDIKNNVKNGDVIMLNGETGEVFINPGEELIQIYKERNLSKDSKYKR